MTTISPGRKLVTLINVFTVEPANQGRLVELLARATETSVRHEPGFISASLHRSLDGTKVTMYAQWRSVEDYQAMRENSVLQAASRLSGHSASCARLQRPGVSPTNRLNTVEKWACVWNPTDSAMSSSSREVWRRSRLAASIF